MKKEIIELVQHAILSKSNDKKELVIGTVSRGQGRIIHNLIGIDLHGVERVLDSYMVKHTLAKHGFAAVENKHGQIAITLDDFALIPQITSDPDKIEYAGKNALKQDLVKYTKRIGNNYIVVEAVRVAKRGNKVVFTTMYKKK